MEKAEMHAFEKAMMEDPMLCDAVDGYRHAYETTDIKEDLSFLSDELKAASAPGAKVVKGSFRQWMSIAAGLVILLSTAVVLYRIFNQSNQNKTIAVTQKTKTDTAVTVAAETKVDSTTVAITENNLYKTDEQTLPKPVIIPPVKLKQELTTKNTTTDFTVSNEPTRTTGAKAEEKTASAPATASVKEDLLSKPETNATTVNQQKTEYKPLNKFLGKVVDENNNPLPFANITEKTSGVGTYADVNGNFVLLSADSVLTVETKSMGFLNSTVKLRGYTNSQNQGIMQNIVLRDAEVVASNATLKNKMLERSKKQMAQDSADTDEMDAMPADGWGNYNTYVNNNLRNLENDEQLKDKRSSAKQVVLSFEVNPDGSLTNIRVEHSNCRQCNNEAIRILKEGPRWKSKSGKKETAKFTVQF
ncbi:MAG: carboxypeptidase-like regulatory domain-containing protein [Chitinophagaceae bacterium]|nr:carboxypeptidase-like regulatory domain-containing protein [Chitinophagaceae bacterium]